MTIETVLLGMFALAVLVLGYMVWRIRGTLADERSTHDLEVEAARAEGRADSRQRAKSVNLGQAIEQFVPWMTDYPFNPRDSRFLGNPIDYIVFAGLRESDDVDEVVFVEVKSGRSQLTKRERSLRDAIEEGRVRHLTVRVPTAREAERMREQAEAA
ncbi:MAG: Holliday junction resolvase [Gammaproteobacteria bacterium]|nr:Holliday junction resolvase [Gammaproteobacteria bacterium]